MSNHAQIRPPLRLRPFSVLRSFLEQEAAGGIVLVGAAALAMLCANSALAGLYDRALHVYVGFELGGLDLRYSVLHWINDGLMAVFFLLVGLEIKREMLDGQLSTWSRRALPGIAALGGMIAPALIYVLANLGNGAGLRGWAIPAATDIAFALGVLSLLGSRAPVSLKIFLTALAILDDLGAIVLIALFYSGGLNPLALGLAAVTLLALVGMNRVGVTRLSPYLVLGAVLWLCMLKSGVHATIAGVALALTIPLRPAPGRPDDETSPLHRLEHWLSRPVAFGIIPLFGFANAGLDLSGIGLANFVEPVPLGIALGLFLGKQIGVFGSIWAVVRFGLADLPAHASWTQVYGVSILCGIGFTMSLFIGSLAFGEQGSLMDATKVGVLSGSILSALVGFTLLRFARGERPAPA